MPLVEYSLVALKAVMDRQELRSHRSILCFSYPDVIVPQARLVEIFGDRVKGLPIRNDSQKTVEWHKAQGILTDVVDTAALFDRLGYKFRCIDVTEGRGGEFIHDLSEWVRPGWGYHGNDIVFDCISHQVFNVATAWFNMASVCRPGGAVVSVTALNLVNNGYWNISPAAYHDFFEKKLKFECHYRAVSTKYGKAETVPTDPVTRLRNVPDDAVNLFVGYKPDDCTLPIDPTDVKWPTMTKFDRFPKSHRS